MNRAYVVDPQDGGSTRVEARPIGAIVTDLLEKTQTLVRQEMRLGIAEAEEKVEALKVELDGKVQQLKLELLAKAIGGLVAFAGLLTVVAAIVSLLALELDLWLAALLVGGALAVGGTVLLKRKMKLPAPPSPASLMPERMIENTKRDLHAIKEARHDANK